MKKINFFKLNSLLILLFIFSAFSTFAQNIITNGDFEGGLDSWVMVVNNSEVGSTLDIDESNPVSGSKSLLLDHKAVGKKGMWRINARAGLALDSGYTYDVYATVKVETTYPDGKRLGLVTKENQSIFAHYWTQKTGTYHLEESFYWSAMSADSITLQWQLGYAGEDYGLNNEAQEFKVYIDDVRVIKRETVQPTAIEIDAPETTIAQGMDLQLNAALSPAEADPFIQWISRDGDIATVEDGLVTGVAGGEVYIVAKSEINSEILDSVLITVNPDIITNGDFEGGLDSWVMVVNNSEVGSTLDIDESNPVSGSKSLLLDHKAVGKKGMWRINARAGLALDSGYTYDVYATVKVETTYPDGKRLGLVTKENQSIFAHYWTQKTGTYHLEESFYWSAVSADSITLQWQLGYAGEDYGLNNEAQEFKVYIDDVRVIKRETVQPTAIAIKEGSQFLVVGDNVQLSASLEPHDAGEFIGWSSQNDAIVSVDDGEITAKSKGQAYIYVKSEVNSDLKDSVLVTVSENIMENGGFENGMDGWVINLNNSEVGTVVEVVDENALEGEKVLLTTHPKVGKKGMWRIQARTGIPLDSGYTYLVRAKLRCETDYETGKRAGIVLKEAQSVFAHYFFVDEEEYNFEEKFVWNSASSDSITLMLQYGYAGEDIGTGDTLEFRFYFDDVVVAKKPAVELEGIDIVNDNIDLKGGAAANVAYTLNPEDGDYSALNWSTANEEVVTVSHGIVQPVGEGETKVYLKASPWDLEDSVVVKVEEVTLTGIEIAGIDRIEAGTSDKLEIVWKPQLPINLDVTWSSSDNEILTVESDGTLRAIKQGFATVTATSALGSFTDDFLVEVFSSVPVTGVELNDGDFAMPDGDTKQLSYSIFPTDAGVKTVTWNSSDTDVVTVNANGEITATGIGTTEITVTTDDGGFTDKIMVTVDPVSVTGISLNINSYEGYTNRGGGAVLLIATVEPDNATNDKVIWSSDNDDLATVDEIGLVSFLANGNVKITATTKDGDYSESCDITILTGVTGVSISDRKVNIKVDETYQLSATILPETASNKNVTWESSDEDVVTVDNNGLITAIAEGTASVSVTTEDGGRKIGCTVTVEAPSALETIALHELKVYPNPAHDVLHIQVSEKIVLLEIYTAKGRKAKSIPVKNRTIELPINQYQQGIYFIRAITNTGAAAIRKVFVD